MKPISREECRQIQLALLHEFTAICQANHLSCYLAYGTLLGAVRHQGFIPWDDDIDLYMERPEYERMLSILKDPAVAKPDWLSLLDLDTEEYYYPFAKIVDNRTVAKMENSTAQHGVWIDIFPMDTLPASDRSGKWFGAYCSFLHAVTLSMTTDFSSKKLYSWKNTLKRRLLCAAAQLVGKKRVALHYDRICKRYAAADSPYAGCLFTPSWRRNRFTKEVLFTPSAFEFEGKTYPGTKFCDVYLRALYGDYMTPPPPEKRYAHYITASWK